ncbi:ABC transporter substrate-binding protein [Ottowia thiooxydans]|uniref:Peptide/nickel transport system substrate-binding protein n=1 Tax=Ottowia thiooxydans TaxID=219182 RepID=A0ABV2QAY1_9BURK
MKKREFLQLGAQAGAALTGLWLSNASAQTATPSVLRVLLEDGANTLDPAGTGYNQSSINLTWNLYDRLVTYGTKPVEGVPGAMIYDYDKIVGQAAERYEVAPDGRQFTFHMRRGAKFHDGTPVTAHDAKWSLDRVISVTTGKAQMATGSLTDPSQFEVIDDMTLRVTVPQADRFTLPNLCVLFPAILNSKVCKANATASDPWAENWLKTNAAGGGPFKLVRFASDQGFMLERNEGWTNGAKPGYARVAAQVVPVAASRRAAAERGEADIIRGLSGRDIEDLKGREKIRLLGIPNPGAATFIALNTQMAPFDNKKVRQAIAHAVPYQEIFDKVFYRRGAPMFGGKTDAAQLVFPQALPYTYNLEKARALLAEAGMASGFSTTFVIDSSLAKIAEPTAILLQESLGKIGVKLKIETLPSGQMATAQAEHRIPINMATGTAWLRNPDYYFRVYYSSPTRWNYGNFKNEEMNRLTSETRYETNGSVYNTKVKRMIEIARDEVPLILMWSAFQDTIVSPSLRGYTYMFHGQLELRHLSRA